VGEGDDGWLDRDGLCDADGLCVVAADVSFDVLPHPASATRTTAMSTVAGVRRRLIRLITGQTVGVGQPTTLPTRGRLDRPA
jgi:hypothetical protein